MIFWLFAIPLALVGFAVVLVVLLLAALYFYHLRLHSAHVAAAEKASAAAPKWEAKRLQSDALAYPTVCNFRDISALRVDDPKVEDDDGRCPAMKAGVLFRCGVPTSASARDIIGMQDDLGIQTWVDLRGVDEVAKDKLDWRQQKHEGIYAAGEPREGDPWGRRYVHVGVFPGKIAIAAIATPLELVSLAVAGLSGKKEAAREKGMAIFGRLAAGAGLRGFYTILLDCGKKELARVLRVLLAAPTPIAFHCTAGKDRTGCVAMLVMLLCGATSEQVIETYTFSERLITAEAETAIRGIAAAGFPEEFLLGTPPEVMEYTLTWFHKRFGTVEGYCLDHLRLTPEEIDGLRSKFSGPTQE